MICKKCDCPHYTVIADVFSGRIVLSRGSVETESRNDQVSGVILSADKTYLVETSIPDDVYIGSPSVVHGNLVIGPLDLGGVNLTLTTSGGVTSIVVENKIMVGTYPGPWLRDIYIEIKEVDPSSGGSGDGLPGPPGKDGKDGVDGKDGKVYVPHVDDYGILTFTIEDAPGDIPGPIDLNPSNGWSGIDDPDMESKYIWEDM